MYKHHSWSVKIYNTCHIHVTSIQGLTGIKEDLLGHAEASSAFMHISVIIARELHAISSKKMLSKAETSWTSIPKKKITANF